MAWSLSDILLLLLFIAEGSAEPLPWNTRLKIAIDAAKGLTFLHSSEKSVIYRDFKASNILLDGVIINPAPYFKNLLLPNYILTKFHFCSLTMPNFRILGWRNLDLLMEIHM